jgi:hypothetical protein
MSGFKEGDRVAVIGPALYWLKVEGVSPYGWVRGIRTPDPNPAGADMITLELRDGRRGVFPDYALEHAD